MAHSEAARAIVTNPEGIAAFRERVHTRFCACRGHLNECTANNEAPAASDERSTKMKDDADANN